MGWTRQQFEAYYASPRFLEVTRPFIEGNISFGSCTSLEGTTTFSGERFAYSAADPEFYPCPWPYGGEWSPGQPLSPVPLLIYSATLFLSLLLPVVNSLPH